MDTQQVQAAKARAAEVVNGFKCATERNARDALKLAEACEAKDRQIAAMKKRMLSDNLLWAARMGRPKNAMEDFFRSVGL